MSFNQPPKKVAHWHAVSPLSPSASDLNARPLFTLALFFGLWLRNTSEESLIWMCAILYLYLIPATISRAQLSAAIVKRVLVDNFGAFYLQLAI